MITSAHTGFSLSPEIIQEIMEVAKPLGHREDRDTLNLGFGFLYYSLVRSLRPKHVVVIGSGYGFSVVCHALALRDNRQGQLTFVDPSFHFAKDGLLKTVGGRNNWGDPDQVRERFARFGVDQIVTHQKFTSDEFFARYDELNLPAEIDLAFIDGNHSYANVKADFINCLARSHKNTYMLLHDTNIYVREMIRHSGVKRWLRALRSEKDAFEFVDFPFSSGVAIVRVIEPKVWEKVS
jgi:predicted O-methyltransferase YrrM